MPRVETEGTIYLVVSDCSRREAKIELITSNKGAAYAKAADGDPYVPRRRFYVLKCVEVQDHGFLPCK